jgi:hypothetical protein
VVTVSTDGDAMLFEFGQSGQKGPLTQAWTYEGHQGPILSARVTKDGAKLLTTGQDATARLWDLNVPRDRDPVTVKGPEGAITTGIFIHTDRALATVSIDGTVREWSIDREELRRAAERVVGRNLTCEEWQRYRRSQPWWRRYLGIPPSLKMQYTFPALDEQGKRSVECPEN